MQPTDDATIIALARAFARDPYFAYVVQDEGRRRVLLPDLIAVLLRWCRALGGVDVVPESRGALAWCGPEEWEITPALSASSGFDAFFPRLTPDEAARMTDLGERDDAIHHAVVPGPHVYLLLLGVDPAHHGGGLGRTLLRGGIARAEALGVPAFLETNLPRNVAFYERHGFRVAEESVTPDGLLTTWHLLHPGGSR